MKKIVKITGLLHLLVLYCFIVSIYNTGLLSAGIASRNHLSTQEGGYFPKTGAHQFDHTNKTENIVNCFSKVLSFSLKNQLNNFVICRKATELFLLNTFSEYQFYSKNIAYRFPKTDIIFPFHYFW